MNVNIFNHQRPRLCIYDNVVWTRDQIDHGSARVRLRVRTGEKLGSKAKTSQTTIGSFPP